MKPLIHTFVPDMPPIELVSYYDEFKAYYPYCEPGTKRWFVENVKDDWVLLDCGANIGYFSILFARLAPRGRVYAFEPTDTHTMLLENLRHHAVGNVTPLRLALGEKSGEIEDGIFRLWGRDPECRRYPFTTIDDFVRKESLERIDCIKIDVDSFDFEVLKGARQTLLSLDPYVVVELNHALNKRSQSNVAALEWLAELGYTEAVAIDYDNFLLKRGTAVAETANTAPHRLAIAFEQSRRDGSLSPSGLDALARNAHGEQLFSQGHEDGALAIFEDAIRRYPEHPVAYNNAGVVLHARKDLAGARRLFEQGLAKASLHKATLCNYVSMLREAGETGRAAASCVEYLRSFPADGEVRSLLKQVNADHSFKVTLPDGEGLAVPVVDVAEMHTRLGFAAPISYPQASREKPFSKWKMEVDDSPIFRYVYRNFAPERHLEFGTWQGTGATYCLEECGATVWTLNLPHGERLPNGQIRYDVLAHGCTREDFKAWTDRAGIAVTGHASDSFGAIGWQYLSRGLGHRVCQIYCDSTSWDSSNLPGGFFDTVLVDGGHDRSVVLSDTTKALPLLRSGGIIMWHDFCASEYRQYASTLGVMEAIGELWEDLERQMSQLFWIYPSWILLGVKK